MINQCETRSPLSRTVARSTPRLVVALGRHNAPSHHLPNRACSSNLHTKAPTNKNAIDCSHATLPDMDPLGRMRTHDMTAAAAQTAVAFLLVGRRSRSRSYSSRLWRSSKMKRRCGSACALAGVSKGEEVHWFVHLPPLRSGRLVDRLRN